MADGILFNTLDIMEEQAMREKSKIITYVCTY